MKLWLQDNDIEMHSTHNEGKSALAERFIRILRLNCVVNLKLAFTECFFYNLIILIKLCKIRDLHLDKALLFPGNQVTYLEN